MEGRPQRFSLMHTYEQNGDLMRDPDVEFVVINGGIYSTFYRQDGLGIARELKPNSKAAADCDRFLATWLKNIKDQGFGPATPPDDAPDSPPLSDDELAAELAGIEETAPKDISGIFPGFQTVEVADLIKAAKAPKVETPAQMYRRAGRILGKAKVRAPEPQTAPIVTPAFAEFRARHAQRIAARATVRR
jgi:hypothetical protein